MLEIFNKNCLFEQLCELKVNRHKSEVYRFGRAKT
jgi:hypothetical protein